MKDFMAGIGTGAGIVTLIALAFILLFRLVTAVFADEAVPVREATLSERYHSYNYTIDDAARDRAHNLEVEVTVVVEGFTNVTPAVTCAQTNARLTFMRERVVKYQQRTPKYAYVYQEVLDLINAQWCHDND